ncbi:hypothetical protein WYO_1825 [Methylobacterium sp. GXF4]|uniref:hypothetical protein n=1 Tax=Methylobacterium sp. GXF4 TaxID=1096546 RepID=UPI0002697C72|nr:hypothetical protein [Methylobacterium sp. GXF4]EIZ85459.1 hypothetical protein WYO_1825 [Methylobacterium sp. GXF4]
MAAPDDPAPKHLPRVLSKADAAAYCALTEKGFDQWVKTGKLPRAMKGTRRWDKVAIDYAIDRMSGVSRDAPPSKPSSLQTWIEKDKARKAADRARYAKIDQKCLNPQRRSKL